MDRDHQANYKTGVSTPRRGKSISSKIFCATTLSCLVHFGIGRGTHASAREYTTSFPLTENPLFEGGNWINGATDGIDWADVSTTPGLAIGLESGSTGYDDATALLTGSWGPNQTGWGTVFAKNRKSGNVYEEVEIRLRSTISPHSCTGYEVLFSLKPDSGCYVQIVRWNGPLGDFTYVATTGGAQFVLHPGDKVMGSVTNNLITAYINGTEVLHGMDTNYTSGSPGIGIFIAGASGVNHDYGFTSFTATDGKNSPPPAPKLAISSPDTNRSIKLQFEGVPGTTYQIQYTDQIDSADWRPVGSVVADGSGLATLDIDIQPGIPLRFYRTVWP